MRRRQRDGARRNADRIVSIAKTSTDTGAISRTISAPDLTEYQAQP